MRLTTLKEKERKVKAGQIREGKEAGLDKGER